jgi:hypothetical protein
MNEQKKMDSTTKDFFRTLNGLFQNLDQDFTANYFGYMHQLFLAFHGLKPGVLLCFESTFSDVDKVKNCFIEPLHDLLEERFIVYLKYSEYDYYGELIKSHSIWVLSADVIEKTGLKLDDDADVPSDMYWILLGYPSDSTCCEMKRYSISYNIINTDEFDSVMNYSSRRYKEEGIHFYTYQCQVNVFKRNRKEILKDARQICKLFRDKCVGRSQFVLTKSTSSRYF